jgi:serine/threonine protein kinase
MQKDIVSKEPKFSHLSGDALDLIKGLLEKNPDERLGNIGGIKEIRGHPFFSDINWDDVINKRYKYHKQLFMKIDVTQSNFNQDISLKDKNG